MIRLPYALLLAALLSSCAKKSAPEPAPAAAQEAAAAGPAGVDAAAGPPVAPSSAEPAEEPGARLKRKLGKAATLLTTSKKEQAELALVELKSLTADYPDVAEIPYNMGVAYLQLGDETNARRSFLRATDIDPSLGNAWLNLGALSEREGQLDRALQNYRAGLRYDPDNAELIVGVVGVLRKMGRHADAIAEARQALAHNATNINAYNNLGLVYLDQGQLELAQFVYQKALNSIEGADQNPMIHANLGKVYLEMDRPGDAKLELEKALALDPDLVAARMFLAKRALDNRDWQTAATLLERARELEPENAAIHQNLGIAYRGLGRYEDSQRSYLKALELDPRNPDPYLNLAVLLGDNMKAFDQAIDQIDDYRRAGGKNVALADAWQADIEAQRDRFEKEKERKARREEAERKKAERERLAKEHEEREAREAAEEARLAEEQARRQAELDQQAQEDAARQAAEQAQEEAARQAAEQDQQEASRQAEADRQAREAAARTAEEAATREAAGGSGSGGDSGSSAPASVWGAPTTSRAAPKIPEGGQVCGGVGQCGHPMLECSRDGVCVTAGTRGAYGVGVGCMDDSECALGLECSANLCTKPVQAPAASPWGGRQ